jgi:hypothetical protein
LEEWVGLGCVGSVLLGLKDNWGFHHYWKRCGIIEFEPSFHSCKVRTLVQKFGKFLHFCEKLQKSPKVQFLQENSKNCKIFVQVMHADSCQTKKETKFANATKCGQPAKKLHKSGTWKHVVSTSGFLVRTSKSRKLRFGVKIASAR